MEQFKSVFDTPCGFICRHASTIVVVILTAVLALMTFGFWELFFFSSLGNY